jgi:hypothetical protein
VGDSPDGRIWVVDLSAAPVRLAAVPDRRSPLISLGSLRLQEGDGPGTVIARVPFAITGDVTRPGRFVAVVAGQARGDVHRFSVDVAPGQTSGSIGVAYEADRRDDFPRSFTILAAWATRDLMTDDYLGQLVVLDDDPSPKITLTPVAGTVREGQSAQWRLRLSTRVDYDVFVSGQVVRSPRPVMRGTDVPKRWLRLHTGLGASAKPLYQLGAGVFDQVRAGQRSVLISIPIRRDGVREPRESLRVRFQLDRLRFASTVHVAASR